LKSSPRFEAPCQQAEALLERVHSAVRHQPAEHFPGAVEVREVARRAAVAGVALEADAQARLST
jgi:hypothetical protein